ncbi:MAG TPA: AmmeMemoRadiSam system protein B [Geobacteraceae bacterium]
MRWRISLRLFILICFFAGLPAGCRAEVKEPAVAGQFYPAAKESLQRAVDGFLAGGQETAAEGKLLAIVAPHAGYQYSGSVAGWAYRRIKGGAFKTVVLMGPSHHLAFKGAAVYAGGSMATPLGNVRVNEKVARSLLDEKAGITFDRAPFAREHSLEVQLPFLQRTLKDFTVVPILLGTPTRESFSSLTAALTKLLRSDDRVLLVISSDLSHYHDAATAQAMDRKVIDALERLSIDRLEQLLSSGEGEMCGGVPALYAMVVTRNLGATNGALFRYANSGDAGGAKGSVVGYAALGIYRTPLTAARKAQLLALARETVDAHVRGKALPDPVVGDPLLKGDGATFVTLNDKNGHLRGCMGNIAPVMPLYRSVIANAVAASSRDPRFLPVAAAELPDLHVEVTVISPLEPLDDIRKIKIGTHGLYLEKGEYRGLLLPQVATEFGWDLSTYLAELSRKAGLPPDGWREGTLYTFTAEIIK